MDRAELRTGRLLLRPWREADRQPFAELNADPEVMEHFPAPLTRAESDALADRITGHFEQRGFGFWAAETLGGGEFIGFVGLGTLSFDFPFDADGPEIGWRLGRRFWGAGYATEGACAALRWAFTDGRFGEVVSFTATTNLRSAAVMRRIGMTRDPAEDFDHPRVPEGHPLRRHVLYRISRDQWVAASA